MDFHAPTIPVVFPGTDGNKWLFLEVNQSTWMLLHDEYRTGIFDFDCILCLKAVIAAICTEVEGIGAVWEPAKAD